MNVGVRELVHTVSKAVEGHDELDIVAAALCVASWNCAVLIHAGHNDATDETCAIFRKAIYKRLNAIRSIKIQLNG